MKRQKMLALTACALFCAASCSGLAAANELADWGSECCPETPACCAHGSLEALFFDRDNRTSRLTVVRVLGEGNPLPGTALLTTGDLDFDWEPGLRATIGWHLDEGDAIEVGYLGIFDWTAAASVTQPNGLAIPGDLGLASLDYFAADRIDLTYGSRLHSAEANYVRSYGDLALLAGVRYLSLDERFRLSAADADTGLSNYRVGTSNDLYGAQVGAKWLTGDGPWEWSAAAKAGLFGNDASQAQTVADFPPSFLLRSLQAGQRTNLAFVGDLNLSALYAFNEIWAVCGGYNLLWVEGIALAPDQLDFTDTPASGRRVTLGGALFHGVSLGLDARW